MIKFKVSSNDFESPKNPSRNGNLIVNFAGKNKRHIDKDYIFIYLISSFITRINYYKTEILIITKKDRHRVTTANSIFNLYCLHKTYKLIQLLRKRPLLFEK